VLLIVAAIVAVILAAFWAFQRPKHVDIALTGPTGLQISGYYDSDGVRKNFTSVVPATIGFDYRRDFDFRAVKNDPGADFTATLSSPTMSYSATTSGANVGVRARYSAPFPGFSSGSMSQINGP
jgi:hypothetical protein